jgi:hypothetical protein
LLKYLKEHYEITEISKGIYSVKNGQFKIYVISLRKLPSDQNLFLTSLQLNLSEQLYNQVLARYTNHENDNAFQIFIETFLNVNKSKFKKGEMKVNPTTIELMEECGIFQQFVQAGEKRGEKRGRANGMFAAKAEDIIRVLTRRFNIPPKQLQDEIRDVRSIEKLDELLDFAITCVSIGEFSTALQ